MKRELIDLGGGVTKWSEAPNLKIVGDLASIPWNLGRHPLMRLVTTNTFGASRQILNPVNGVEGKEYTLVYVQNATGGRNLTFDTNYKICSGFIDLKIGNTTIVKIMLNAGIYKTYLYPDELFGTTAQRPITKVNGITYFDTTLNKPIFWNGSNWLDSTGATL